MVKEKKSLIKQNPLFNSYILVTNSLLLKIATTSKYNSAFIA
jgi:hypothetical protein